MARIPARSVEDAPAEARPPAEMIQFSPTGRLLNMHAQMPAVLEAYMSIRRAPARLGTLDQQVCTALMLAADYYVEVPAGPASVAFSRRRFTGYREDQAVRPCDRTEIILDFQAVGADAEYPQIAALDVDWVMPPATQPRETAR